MKQQQSVAEAQLERIRAKLDELKGGLPMPALDELYADPFEHGYIEGQTTIIEILTAILEDVHGSKHISA